MGPPDPVRSADRLVSELAGYGGVLVAFSGGVDSSVVLAGAVRALGTGRVVAMTAASAAVPAAELAAARAVCGALGVPQRVVETGELAVAAYRENGPRRCYFCKATLLDAAAALAAELGLPAVATGTNASDVVAGFRPGIRAAAERGARTPLADLGLDKGAVRAIAAAWELSTWDKPAAPCLSSRIAYGVAITPARLARVERAELAVRRRLASHGLRDLRVRDLGGQVRVEVDGDLVDRARAETALLADVGAAGFAGMPVTVEPFRSGGLNDLLPDPERWRH